MIHLVATSHGTDNPQGREAVNLIREQLTALAEAQTPGTYAAVTEPLVLPGDAASAAVVASVALERATEALAALSA